MDHILMQLDEKLRQRNERSLKKLKPWGGLLDVTGWCVALDWPVDGL